LKNWQNPFKITITDRLHKLKAGLKIPTAALSIDVIIKQAADTALLIAMAQMEVFVTPLLKVRIDAVAKRRAQVMTNLMPMYAVGKHRIKRRQIKTATKPPNRLFALGFSNE